jgi:hypothetical protein
MNENKQTIEELLAEIEQLKEEKQSSETSTKIVLPLEPVIKVIDEPEPEPVDDFKPLKRDYVYVLPVTWHPRFVLGDPAKEKGKAAFYYANCTEVEKEAILKANAGLADGTTYPKYQGIYDASTVETEYIISGMRIVLCLLVGSFPEAFLAKENVYKATDEDLELARKMTVKMKGSDPKKKDKWTNEEQFRYCLRQVTSKSRVEKGL